MKRSRRACTPGALPVPARPRPGAPSPGDPRRAPAPSAPARLDLDELDAGELAERLPVGSVVAQVHHLVVRAAVREPAVQALAQPGRGPELPVGHLQGRQYLAVQVL